MVEGLTDDRYKSLRARVKNMEEAPGADREAIDAVQLKMFELEEGHKTMLKVSKLWQRAKEVRPDMKLSAEYERQMTSLARKFIKGRDTDPAAIGRRATVAQTAANEKNIFAKAKKLAQRPAYKTVVNWKAKRAKLAEEQTAARQWLSDHGFDAAEVKRVYRAKIKGLHKLKKGEAGKLSDWGTSRANRGRLSKALRGS